MAKRHTAKEYKEAMQDLVNKTEKLKLVIITRLYTLCASYPEAPITQQGDTSVKAKCLIPQNLSKDYIKDLPFDTQIQYIATIEKWLADQHPHQQTNIKFPEHV